MILQDSHIIVVCPVCGRPLELTSQYVNHEMTCCHCRGNFTAHETNDGRLSVDRRMGSHSLRRVDQRPCAVIEAHVPESECHWHHRLGTPSPFEDEWRPERLRGPLSDNLEYNPESQPTALLVEHRDEAFARIATDMADCGLRVIRARSATEALRLCGEFEPMLVVANLDLRDQSSWLLAAKLRFIDRDIRVWLYQTSFTGYESGMADFLNVDALLDHEGDLLGLSESIVDLISQLDKPHEAVHDINQVKEPVAA